MNIVYYRGSGDFDHLGDGKGEHSSHPRLVESLVEKKVIAVAVGSHHCLAVTTAGDVYGWGRDSSGGEQDKGVESLPLPTLIPEASKQGVVYLSCGAHEVSWREEEVREEDSEGKG